MGVRRLRAAPRDAEGAPVKLALPITWRIVAGGGTIEPAGPPGLMAVFRAPDAECDVEVEATGVEDGKLVTGSARIRVVEGMSAGLGQALGIPAPRFVEDAGSDWRSRMREGCWEVNRAHPDFADTAGNERRQLRYLSSLLGKEVVLHSLAQPQYARPLEQLVRLMSILEASLGGS
jgi:hypothetical protein